MRRIIQNIDSKTHNDNYDLFNRIVALIFSENGCLDSEKQGDIRLVVSEMTANCRKHAKDPENPGMVTVEAIVDGRRLSITITSDSIAEGRPNIELEYRKILAGVPCNFMAEESKLGLRMAYALTESFEIGERSIGFTIDLGIRMDIHAVTERRQSATLCVAAAV